MTVLRPTQPTIAFQRVTWRGKTLLWLEIYVPIKSVTCQRQNFHGYLATFSKTYFCFPSKKIFSLSFYRAPKWKGWKEVFASGFESYFREMTSDIIFSQLSNLREIFSEYLLCDNPGICFQKKYCTFPLWSYTLLHGWDGFFFQTFLHYL